MKFLLIIPAVLTLFALIVVYIGQQNHMSEVKGMKFDFVQTAKITPSTAITYDELTLLPAPVARYLQYTLSESQSLIKVATLKQQGRLRTDLQSDSWIAFSAQHIVVPNEPGFIWDARVSMPFGLHVNVIDSFMGGKGTGKINLMSAIPFGGDADNQKISASALHRYLGEAVWYPTALVPQKGPNYELTWLPLGDQSAVARMTVGKISVSLQFHFNEQNQVERIYTKERYAKTESDYELRPWEAVFSGYTNIEGMHVPTKAKVGWYIDDEFIPVWQGSVESFDYKLSNMN